MVFEASNKFIAVTLRFQCSEVDLSRAEDPCSPGFREPNLDSRVHIGFKVGTNAKSLKVDLQMTTGDLIRGIHRCREVHQDYATDGLTPFHRALFETRVGQGLEHTQKFVHSRLFVVFMPNAGEMKDSVVEDLDCDFLALLTPVSIVEENNGHGIVSKSRRRIGLRGPAMNAIALGFSASKNTLLFDLDERVAQGHVPNQNVCVQLHGMRIENNHGGQLRRT